jgi:hypothetical protein
MTADPVVMDHLAAVGIHDYSGSDGGIGARSPQASSRP